MKLKPVFFKDLTKDNILLSLKILSMMIMYSFYFISIISFQLIIMFTQLSMKMYSKKNKKVYKVKKYKGNYGNKKRSNHNYS